MWLGLVSLFPEMFGAVTEYGITGRAVERSLIRIECFNPRDHTKDRHRTVDDKPYGGGPGMLMKVQPLSDAIGAAQQAGLTARSSAGMNDSFGSPDTRGEVEGRKEKGQEAGEQEAKEQEVKKQEAKKQEAEKKIKVVYLTPQGVRLDQKLLRELAKEEALILVCGRYEGIDERVIEQQVDLEVSIGDYVLSGGELAAMVLVDGVTRLLPGALGDSQSATLDSFEEGLLDHPHYTRPDGSDGEENGRVPEVLLSGDHGAIARWRRQQALGRTWERRPELLANRELNDEDRELLDNYLQEKGGEQDHEQE